MGSYFGAKEVEGCLKVLGELVEGLLGVGD